MGTLLTTPTGRDRYGTERRQILRYILQTIPLGLEMATIMEERVQDEDDSTIPGIGIDFFHLVDFESNRIESSPSLLLLSFL